MSRFGIGCLGGLFQGRTSSPHTQQGWGRMRLRGSFLLCSNSFGIMRLASFAQVNPFLKL